MSFLENHSVKVVEFSLICLLVMCGITSCNIDGSNKNDNDGDFPEIATVSSDDDTISLKESLDSNNDCEEEDVMSGELIKDTEQIVTDNNVADEEILLDEVTQVLCPTSVSDRRESNSYGEVTHITYFSNTTNCERGANILLPANYDDSKKYPVVYFLHGIFGDENSMLGDPNNHLIEITGNLAADELIKDIIVVFPNMFATGDPKLEPGFKDEQIAPYDNFINDLVDDLIPYIENNYSVLSGRENRALIGFSMGGRESIYIGVRRHDLFDYIGAIAPAPGVTPSKDWAMTHPGQLSEEELFIANDGNEPKLFMVCCGTKDSVVGKFPLSYHEIMSGNGTRHLWYEVPDADHDSNAIRSGYYNFLVRMFLR